MSEWPRFEPSTGTKEDYSELKSWQAERTNAEYQPYRCLLMRGWELNRLYTINNQQWLSEASPALFSTGAGYGISPFLQPIRDRSWCPRPVQNEMLPVLQNEVARLLGGGTSFKVRRTQQSTRIDEAASLGEDVLKWQNIQLDWPGIEREFVRDMVVFGIGVLRTGQVTDWQRTITKPEPLRACPNCQFMMLEKSLGEDESIDGKPAWDIVSKFGGQGLNFRAAGTEDFRRPEFDPGEDASPTPRAKLDRCPMCGAVDLISRPPESGETVDFRGEPVRSNIPLNDVNVATITPYDFFPARRGRLDPDKRMRTWHRETIVSLDYVARYFEKGYRVTPDSDVRQRAMWHPQGLEDGRFAHLIGAGDSTDYEDCCVLRESARDPYFTMKEDGTRQYHDKGRWIISAGNEVLIDEDLMIVDKRSGDLVPRVQVQYAQWEPLPGSCFGMPLMSYLRTMQDKINTIDAQVQQMRHTFGNPKLLLPPGTSMEYVGQASGGYQNDVYTYTGNQPPTEIKGQSLAGDWKAEYQYSLEGIQRVSSTRDVEQGNAPAGVTAASALELLAAKASVTRQPRENGKKICIQSSLKHRLQLMGALYETPRQFVASERGDRDAIRSFKGTDLVGQYDVVIEPEPFVESPILRREAATEAFKEGTLPIRTAGDRERYLRAKGVPNDIAPGQGVQVKEARGEALRFMDVTDTPNGEVAKRGETPVVKGRLDDDEIHIGQHTEDWFSSDFARLRKNWPKIAKITYGWMDEYTAIRAQMKDLKLNPPGVKPDPALAIDPMTGQPSEAEESKNAEVWSAKVVLKAQLDALPQEPQDLILHVWMGMIAKANPPYQLEDSDEADDLGGMIWRSHIEAHYEELQDKAMRAAVGQAMGAPGSPGATPPPTGAPGPTATAGAGTQSPMPASAA